VSDGDLQFPPAKRREPSRFEPPPWEREQFEELSKSRSAETPELAETPAEAQETAEPDGEAHAGEAEKPATAEVPESVSVAADRADAGSPAVDPNKVEMMMLNLRAEEPRVEEAYWRIATALGGVCSLGGLVITVWGFAAMTTLHGGGGFGALLASLVVMAGLGFIGVGVWLIVRAFRQQGVL
jgi:hypothetical protein